MPRDSLCCGLDSSHPFIQSWTDGKHLKALVALIVRLRHKMKIRSSTWNNSNVWKDNFHFTTNKPFPVLSIVRHFAKSRTDHFHSPHIDQHFVQKDKEWSHLLSNVRMEISSQTQQDAAKKRMTNWETWIKTRADKDNVKYKKKESVFVQNKHTSNVMQKSVRKLIQRSRLWTMHTHTRTHTHILPAIHSNESIRIDLFQRDTSTKTPSRSWRIECEMMAWPTRQRVEDVLTCTDIVRGTQPRRWKERHERPVELVDASLFALFANKRALCLPKSMSFIDILRWTSLSFQSVSQHEHTHMHSVERYVWKKSHTSSTCRRCLCSQATHQFHQSIHRPCDTFDLDDDSFFRLKNQ